MVEVGHYFGHQHTSLAYTGSKTKGERRRAVSQVSQVIYLLGHSNNHKSNLHIEEILPFAWVERILLE